MFNIIVLDKTKIYPFNGQSEGDSKEVAGCYKSTADEFDRNLTRMVHKGMTIDEAKGYAASDCKAFLIGCLKHYVNKLGDK